MLGWVVVHFFSLEKNKAGLVYAIARFRHPVAGDQVDAGLMGGREGFVQAKRWMMCDTARVNCDVSSSFDQVNLVCELFVAWEECWRVAGQSE